MDELKELRPFLDEDGRLTALPAKRKKQRLAFWYLAGKLEPGRVYTEKELGALLDAWTAFHDPATLRRELYDHLLVDRAKDGSRYWREKELPPLEEFLRRYS